MDGDFQCIGCWWGGKWIHGGMPLEGSGLPEVFGSGFPLRKLRMRLMRKTSWAEARKIAGIGDEEVEGDGLAEKLAGRV